MKNPSDCIDGTNPDSQNLSLCCPACRSENNCTPVGSKNGCRIVQCSTCKTYFVSFKDAVQDYTDYHSTSNYKAKSVKKIRRASRRIRKLRECFGGNTFLDIGCNAGFAVEAARQIGLQAHGVDVDPVAIAFAQETFPEARFFCEDIASLAASGKRFDIIYTSEVIEHIAHPLDFLSSAFALLAPGGVLYLTTPDSGHWLRPRNFLAWKEVFPPEHIVWFNRSSLRDALLDVGFTNIKMQFNLKTGIRLTARKECPERKRAAEAALPPGMR